MKKSAVVFGGAGFIGSHLLARLARSGAYERLIAVDLKPARFTTPGVEYLRLDVREAIPTEICPGVSEIYNFAAVHITPGHQDWEYFWTNVRGASNICEFARASGVRHIVFTSSIAVYGATEAVKDESSAPEPESAYGRSKLCAEEIHRLWQREDPARRLVIVRPAAIYGRAEAANFTRLARLLSKGRFIYPGRTDTIKACGYVKDLVRSMEFMLERCQGVETYNFCHARRYTTAEICAAFSAVAGFPQARLRIPLQPMLAAGWAFEMAAHAGIRTSINRARVLKLVRSNNIEPGRLKQSGFRYGYDLASSLADWHRESGVKSFA
jgi:nucleoside-diphosphate-sugar epimerase